MVGGKKLTSGVAATHTWVALPIGEAYSFHHHIQLAADAVSALCFLHTPSGLGDAATVAAFLLPFQLRDIHIVVVVGVTWKILVRHR